MLTTAFLHKSEVYTDIPEFIEKLFKIDRGIVSNQLCPMLDILRDDLICFIEYPYVDRFYRDTFYTFYSKKHNTCNRNSVRISFFHNSLDFKNYFKVDNNDLKDLYFGFISLRPTTYRIIGHSFISPKGLINNDFVCCLNNKVVSIFGTKLSVYGFPYCSQDNESITCSEASIINLMDYFGHKYPEYSTILPSQVNRILSRQSFQRQLPTHGLPTESISFVLKKIGFGTVVYSCDPDDKASDLFRKEEFKELLYIYIESGIPLIATLSTKNKHHAILIIGRENIDREIPFGKKSFFKREPRSYEFSEAFDKVLIMNDNHPPYEFVDYYQPLKDNESGDTYQIRSFIVPLYTKVFLDAYQFKSFFFIVLNELESSEGTKHVKYTQKGEDYIYRFFLTSSKSYKNYLAISQGLTDEFKLITINKSMPKFIWVGEILRGNKINRIQIVDSIIVVDATESGLTGHLIFATNSKYLIIKNTDNQDLESDLNEEKKYEVFEFTEEIFYTFANNLKGDHTKWQN
jgi:hypothetical protein